MSDENYPDTSAIEKAKKEKNPEKKPSQQASSFFSSLLSQIILLLICVFVGGLMLYSCKVSQTGLIPLDINCGTYTNFSNYMVDSDNININIDIVKLKDTSQSTKIYFPFKENNEIISNGFIGIGFLKSWIEGENSNTFTRYIGTIWQNVYILAFRIYNFIYNLLNQYVIETLIIFLGPFILPFIYFPIMIILTCYGFILFFTKFYLLFGEKDYCPIKPIGDGEFIKNIKWKDPEDSLYKDYNWFFVIVYLIIMLCCLLPLIFISGILSFICNIVALIMPLMLKAKVSNSGGEKTIENDKTYTVLNALENILKYKLNIIMYIITYYILIDAYASLGAYGVVVTIIGIIFIYIFYPEIYKNHIPIINKMASTSGLVEFKTYISKCMPTLDIDTTKKDILKCDGSYKIKRTWIDYFFGPIEDDNFEENPSTENPSTENSKENPVVENI